MTSKRQTPTLPKHPCDGSWPDPDNPRETIHCDAMVAERRPSASGRHFCPRPKCQTAKQRFYRQRRLEQARLEGRDIVIDLLTAVMRNQRSDCATCGHPNALVGWAHRAPDMPGGTCTALGSLGRGLPKGAIDVVHPERAPAQP